LTEKDRQKRESSARPTITPPEERFPVLRDENPVLRRRARPVTKFNRSLMQTLERMVNTMYHSRGVGLAAPQVGLSQRAVVMDDGTGLRHLVNPQITRQEGSVGGWEGCLSLPGLTGKVTRPERVQVRAQDAGGRPVWFEAEGWSARILCHEVDHLDGVLFVDRADEVVELPPETCLRVVFMGTPDFAVPVLQSMLAAGCQVVGVVTQPDRPRGRGQREHPSPVKLEALEQHIPLLQPEKASDGEFARRLKWLEPDLLVTAAYGQILKPCVLEIPRLGCLNVHASLLPAYRGAAPIQRALMAGEETTGITIIWMDEGMDTGPIVLQREIEVGTDESYGELYHRLARMAAKTLMEALHLAACGEAPRIPQQHDMATYAPRITREETIIDWQRASAREVHNLVRALSPRPGASTTWGGRTIKMLSGCPCKGPPAVGVMTPGRVVALSERGFAVACRRGVYEVHRLQVPGKPAVMAPAFLNGYDLRVGDTLGNYRKEED